MLVGVEKLPTQTHGLKIDPRFEPSNIHCNSIETISFGVYVIKLQQNDMTRHDRLSSIVQNEMLRRWREGVDGWNDIGTDIIPVKCKKTFPSPDMAFWDEENQWNIRCEFKPPKESDKRDTIHTGLGQAVGYLHPSVGAQLTYQVAPNYLGGGFDSGEHLRRLFSETIHGKLPVGLILYNPENPIDIEMAVPVDQETISGTGSKSNFNSADRYWAKHVDTTTMEIYNLLYNAFSNDHGTAMERRNHIIEESYEWLVGSPPYMQEPEPHVFWPEAMSQDRTAWREKLLSDGTPYPGHPRLIGGKKRSSLRKKIESGELNMHEAERAITEWLFQPDSKGNRYIVVYKNSMMLLDHLDLWDSNYRLTDDGMDLFLTGKKYGPNSMMFIDLFARLMLINGSHHRLIMDLCEFTSGHEFENHKDALSAFVEYYSQLGYIRYNEGRATERKGGTDQLKYELLLWGKLGLLDKYGGQMSGVDGGKSGWKKGYGFCFNHRRIGDLLS